MALAIFDDMGAELDDGDHDEMDLLRQQRMLHAVDRLVDVKLSEGRRNVREDTVDRVIVALDLLRYGEDKAQSRAGDVGRCAWDGNLTT